MASITGATRAALAACLLSGLTACGVVGSAADVAGTAVSTPIEVTGKAVGGAIDTVTPDDD